MRNMLFFVVLYSIAQAAAAECGTVAPADDEVARADAPITRTAARDASLMKTAARETVQTTASAGALKKVVHDEGAVPVRSETLAEREPPPRAKTAMLIAAVAVMLTIALRRAGSFSQ